MRIFGYVLVIFLSFQLLSCVADEEVNLPPAAPAQTVFGAFEIAEENEAILSGTITEATANDLTALITAYPTTDRILMGNISGATSPEAAFAAARVVRSNRLDLHITDNSAIRREAVDFFLGGIKRTKGQDVKIGVGAWVNDQGQQATDFGFGHEAHLPWINFYQEMEFQFQLAADFYNFSIFAADANSIFYLTEDQINTFNIIN